MTFNWNFNGDTGARSSKCQPLQEERSPGATNNSQYPEAYKNWTASLHGKAFKSKLVYAKMNASEISLERGPHNSQLYFAYASLILGEK